MKTLTKIIVASTAGILSAGLATAGAFAATGVFSVQDQVGAAIDARGVTGSTTHAVHSATTTGEQKASSIRGEVAKSVASASPAPALPSLLTKTPSVPGTSSTAGSVSATAGSETGSGVTASAAGTSGTSAAAKGAATVVAPPAAVDVRGNVSVTLGH